MKNIFKIISNYQPAGDQPNAIRSLTSGIKSQQQYQILLGVTGSGKTFTIAHVIAEICKPTLIMAPNKTLAAQLYGEFKTYFPSNSVEYFVSYYDYYQPEAYLPASDTFIEKDAAINAQIEQMRLSATKALIERQDTIIVATVSAIYGLGDPNSYLQMILHLSQGEQYPQRKILQRLIEMQYTRTTQILERGQFRATGEIIDIFPADSESQAIRIELFDDEIIKLVWFDPLTGKILQHIRRITIFPENHYVTPRDKILSAIELIKVELQQRIQEFTTANKLIEAQRIEQRTNFDIEMMLELGYCNGIENYSRYLSGREAGEAPPTLFDYLPKESLLILDESHVTVPQIGAMYRGDRARKETLVQYGFRLPSALDNRPLRFEEFTARSPQTIYVSATPGVYELEITPNITEQLVRPTGLVDPKVIIRPVSSQIDDVLMEIQTIIHQKERILITTLTKRMAEDLTDYLLEQKIKVRYLHSDIDTIERVKIIRDLRLGVIDVLIGINLLREGLDIPEVSLVAILDADKEGFLRSERSLIQTIGRAARHINGRAILYADKITGSMQRALNETNRRRQKQQEYNILHNITPQGIKKAIHDTIDNNIHMNEESLNDFSTTVTDPKEILQEIQLLNKTMHLHAQNMEFEKAAQVRDRILYLRGFL